MKIRSMVGISPRAAEILLHLKGIWQAIPTARRLMEGPYWDLPEDFCILEFPPQTEAFWAYSTCCMSQPGDSAGLELHLFSPVQADLHVELLTAVAHYHRTGARLGLGHTVNFGRPWLPGSQCEYGLISLPYLHGPALENLSIGEDRVRCLWLLPITKSEKELAVKNGVEALEQKFEEKHLNYLDARRKPVV